jgi:DNA-binding NarL/FixJ family response regulator
VGADPAQIREQVIDGESTDAFVSTIVRAWQARRPDDQDCWLAMTEQEATFPARRIRVGIVDDSDEIRRLLRLLLESDPRFEVVGEGADGQEAIRLVASATPDLLILDQHMPTLSGVEALPEIRRQAPGTAVVLYAGGTDPHLSSRALAAGAVAVLEKMAVGSSIVDRLADILLGHLASAEPEVELRLGPVDASAARVWVDNTTTIMAALRAQPDVLAEPVPDDVLDVFDGFLETWRALAMATEDFYWAARAQVAEVERLVDCWARIDRMSDLQLATLGVHWSPPEGEPFFRALTACVIDAISSRQELASLAAVLAGQWSNDRPSAV